MVQVYVTYSANFMQCYMSVNLLFTHDVKVMHQHKSVRSWIAVCKTYNNAVKSTYLRLFYTYVQ